MSVSSLDPRFTIARLVNARWDFACEWGPLGLALEQFAAHDRVLQDGLVLEWRQPSGEISRLLPADIRRLLPRNDGGAARC